MSERTENIGLRETLRHQRKRLAATVVSHRDSIRAALPVLGEPASIEGEYVLNLALSLQEALTELGCIDKKIAILNEQLDG